MRFIISFLVCILYLTNISAQNAYKTIAVSTGVSTDYLQLFAIQYESSKNAYLTLGCFAESFFNKNILKFNVKSKNPNNPFICAGAYIKKSLSSDRNFTHSVYVGAAAGTNKSLFIYYPFAGLEQSLFISPGRQLFISEKVLYVFGVPSHHWQGLCSVGYKISL